MGSNPATAPGSSWPRGSRLVVVAMVALVGLAGCDGDAVTTTSPADPASPEDAPSDVTPSREPTTAMSRPATTTAPVAVPSASASSDRPRVLVDALVPDDGSWSQPYGVDVGPDGTTYVLDAGSHRVVAFDPAGNQVAEWGGQGRGDGQFDTLDFGALAVAPDGTVHVVDNGNARIQSFDPSGTFLRAWGGEGDGPGKFRRAIGIAVDDQGQVYVTDDERPTVQVFDAQGVFVREFGTAGDGPGGLVHATGIDVDGRGHAWVADYEARRVQEFDPSGTAVGEYRIPGPIVTTGTPEGVLALEDGRVWVTDYGAGRVVRLPAEPVDAQVDELPEVWLVAGAVDRGEGSLQAPVDLALSPDPPPDALLVVTDQRANTVQRFGVG